MNPLLIVAVLVLLSGFALLYPRLRRASAGRAPAWVFVLATCVSGLILGLMATGISTFHEPSWKPILSLICDGQVENQSRTSSYQAPLSRTHDSGLTTVSTMLYCVDANGDRQPVTGRFMATSTLVYGGVFSLFLLWLLTLRRRSASPVGNPVSRAASPARPGFVTVNGQAVNADLADDVQQLALRLAGSSALSGTSHTVVTVNGQAVDADVANDVQQLVQRVLESPASNDTSNITRRLFEKVGGAQGGSDLDSRLRQLKRLHDQRLITDADYAMAKAGLLSRL